MDLKILQTNFQQKLESDWLIFQKTKRFEELKFFYNWLHTQNFYQTRDQGNFLSQNILHPAQWFAALEIMQGCHLLEGQNGYYFEFPLPGSPQASASVETEKTDFVVRVFKNNLYSLTAKLATVEIEFMHGHDRFYFSRSPQISLISL
jgi:hypothetical protein